jgi:hypothetical protein
MQGRGQYLTAWGMAKLLQSINKARREILPVESGTDNLGA